MIKKTILSLIYFFPLLAHSNEIDAVHRYIGFINRISQGEVFSHEEVAATLFAPNCKKIFNGSLYTQTREDFVSDLIQVNKTYGNWTVRAADIFVDSPNKTAVLRLYIDIVKLGDFTAIVILRFDENDRITEINEVFNKVEKSYSFEGKQ